MRQDILQKYLDEIFDSFGGIREPVDEKKLREAFEAKLYQEVVRMIEKDMGITATVEIVIVDKIDPSNPSAGIMLPNNILEADENYPFVITIRRSTLDFPFIFFVMIMAHELSHIALALAHSELATVEKAVDITTMFLGYRKFYSKGAYFALAIEELNCAIKQFSADFRSAFGEQMHIKVTPKEVCASYLSCEEILTIDAQMDVLLSRQEKRAKKLSLWKRFARVR